MSQAQSIKRNGQVRTFSKIAILLALSIYFAYNVISGKINNYVNPEWSWLSTVASVLCLLLSIASMFAYLRENLQTEPVRVHAHDERDAHAHEGHNHTTATWPVLSVLVVPLVLGIVVPSAPLGASALENSTGTSQAMIERAGPAHGTDTTQWNIWDWQRTYYANVHPDAWFSGKEGNFSGFVFHPGGLGPDQFVLARYVMRHCAADAFGVGMLVVTPGGGSLQQDSWLQVKGQMEVEDFQGDRTLLVRAINLVNLASPDNPYIYPSFYVVSK